MQNTESNRMLVVGTMIFPLQTHLKLGYYLKTHAKDAVILIV